MQKDYSVHFQKKKVSKAVTGFVPIKNSSDINFIGEYLLEKVPRSDSICTFFFFSKNAAWFVYWICQP